MRIPVAEGFSVLPGAGPQGAVAAPPSPNVAAEQVQQQGRAMSQAGRVAVDIAADMQRDINEARVKERDNVLAEQMRVALSEPGGYLTLLGKDAVDGYDKAREALAKLATDAGADLENDKQRRMYADVSQRRLQTAMQQAGSHAAQQTKTYALSQSAARADSAARDMVTNVGDPKLYGMAKGTLDSELRAVARIRGLSPEETDNLVVKAMTEAHSGVIDNLVESGKAGAAQSATAYFDKYKGEIDARLHDEIKKKLETAGIKDDSLRLALDLQSKMGYDQQVKSLDDMYKGGMVTVDLRDATRQRLDYEENRRKAKEQEQTNSLLGSAQDWILKNPGRSILDMPTGLYNWAKQKGHLAALQSFAVREGKPDTNPALFTELRFLAVDDPVAFVERVRRDAPMLQFQLSPSEYTAVVGQATAVTSRDLKAQELNATVARAVRNLTGELRAAGLPTNPKPDSKEAKNLALFQSKLINELDARTTAKGSALTDEEARQVGLGLLQAGELQGSGWFFDDKTMRYQVTPEQQNATPFVGTRYKAIPKATRDKIEAFLAVPANAQKHGVPLVGGQAARGAAEWQQAVERLYQGAVDAGVK